jgi:uncharacterized protein YlxP (DUF503 family)
MVIGILQVRLSIDDAESLKDKRRVVQSLKARLHREHMVSVAEVDQQENMASATLGIVMAGSDARYTQSVLDRIVDKLRPGRGFVLADHRTELLTGH